MIDVRFLSFRLRQSVDESVESQRKALEEKEHYERELRQSQSKTRVSDVSELALCHDKTALYMHLEMMLLTH